MATTQKHTAKSAFKNPDKYIEKLKREIKWANRRISQRDSEIMSLNQKMEESKTNAYGNKWFDFKSPGHKIGVDLSGTCAVNTLDKLNIGDTIIGFGEVAEFTRSKDENNSVKMYIKEIFLKATK